MKYIAGALVIIGLGAAGTYLLMNSHPTAGGWLIFACMFTAWGFMDTLKGGK